MTRAARCLALLLLLLSPGLGGLWLTAGHPCGTAAGATSAARGPHSHHADPSGAPRPHPCDCLAHCSLSLVNLTPAAPVLALVGPPTPSNAPASLRRDIRIVRSPRLLPLATAPPQLS